MEWHPYSYGNRWRDNGVMTWSDTEQKLYNLVRNKLREKMSEYAGKTFITNNTMCQFKTDISSVLRKFEKSLGLYDDFFEIHIMKNENDLNVVDIDINRNFAAYPMTREEFLLIYGYDPPDTELTKINSPGSWCPKCKRFRYMCQRAGKFDCLYLSEENWDEY